MGEKPETSQDAQEKPKGKRLDLNLPQVAGSAVAAVVAAKLAAGLGVYGTIVGAGVVSVLATCGGSLFQHFFRRTGEQIRDVAGQAIPKGRQVPVTADGRPVPETFRSDAVAASVVPPEATTAMRTDVLPRTTTWGMGGAPAPDADATTVLPALDAERTRFLKAGSGDPERTQLLTADGGDPEKTQLLNAGVGGGDPEKTQLLRAGGRAGGPELPPPSGDLGDGFTDGLIIGLPDEFTEGTTHRARVRSWKRPLVAAAVVFGVTMGGITTYELASGQSFSGDGQRTTLREAFTGGGAPSPRNDDTPVPSTSQEPSDSSSSGTRSGTPQDGSGAHEGDTGEPTPTPSASEDSHTGHDNGSGSGSGTGGDKSTPTPTPTPTPSASQSSDGADVPPQQDETPAQ
ncbi:MULTISPECIES: hypothetical protein [unclassified Streptomyces]|uniref:Uncharacterized protein n=1 Tax=Streptomyces sp. NBC_00119 TaxID=2975659 RepID=A0AAU1U576_9ACTN|nr:MULTISPECIES: hypothetical protein [unclassified Streptomyces]MCX4642615.1 hypothetical protein [Streptomyces sp. NBC_01446]MCX5327556.1 hypothetical protein [Streptomyces sp. NBC_00120]